MLPDRTILQRNRPPECADRRGKVIGLLVENAKVIVVFRTVPCGFGGSPGKNQRLGDPALARQFPALVQLHLRDPVHPGRSAVSGACGTPVLAPIGLKPPEGRLVPTVFKAQEQIIGTLDDTGNIRVGIEIGFRCRVMAGLG